jgi:molybdate transport system permease protein
MDSRPSPPSPERRVPRRWLLLLAGSPVLLLILLPVAAIVARIPPALLLANLSETATLDALRLSLVTSMAASALVMALGTPLAYLVARAKGRGVRLLEVLVDLPTVLPPAVAGLGLLMAFGRRGLLGPWLESLGVEVAFTTSAVVLAQAFVAAPFFIKSASVGLAGVNREQEQAASLDGASALRVFRYVTLPQSWRSFLGGAMLCWARAIGEFGATIIFAGNFPGRTQTMPLAVYMSLEIDLGQALTLAAILLLLSFTLLAAVRLLLREPETEG